MRNEDFGEVAYYYTRDHLGSIRELTDSTDTIQARYDYDRFGRTTLVQGTNLSDFQYAGYYEHQPSGLSFTYYRAYDPNTAKWLSRDPLPDAEISQGPNLYDYVYNDPFIETDPLGLLAFGFSIEVSSINPLTSGGGGSYGLNVEYTSDKGLGVYGYNTPKAMPSYGFSPGISATLNIATGKGPWTGPFVTSQANLGPLTAGAFHSIPSNPGYKGMQAGLAAGPPGASITVTDYKLIFFWGGGCKKP